MKKQKSYAEKKRIRQQRRWDEARRLADRRVAEEKWEPKIVKAIDGRIPQNERIEGLFYYECRHNEVDWITPVTVEKNSVHVNFWGTIATVEPLDFGKMDYIELSKAEAKVIVDIATAAQMPVK